MTQPPALVTVKQERPDEAEIRELAAKMVEANRAKAQQQQHHQQQHQAGRPLLAQGQNLIQGQINMLNYVTRGGKTAPNSTQPPAATPPVSEKKAAAPDESSWKGHFGWDKVGECHIPYLLRAGEKYCAVRMVEMKLLSKYLCYLHADIYTCTCIRSYYITEAESRLLNDINLKHCDQMFGAQAFTQKDLVVRLSDADEFYRFLDVCYNKLSREGGGENANGSSRCGFIRINRESVVPYTVRDGHKYVPLFYFEGETENLKLKADRLEGWDLSYLKFCCKVQGIRNELFASETCSVISLADIKTYFPIGTEFEEYWPNKMLESQLLVPSKGSLSSNAVGQWTRAPPAPPNIHSGSTGMNNQMVSGSGRGRRANSHQNQIPHPQLVAAAQRNAPLSQAGISAAVQALANGWNGLVNGQPAFGNTLSQAQSHVYRLAQAQAAVQAQAAARYNSVARNNASHAGGLTAAQARQIQQQYSNNALSLAMLQQQQQQSQQQQRAQQQQTPPSLSRLPTTNNVPAHQSSAPSSRSSQQQATNGHHSSDSNRRRLTPIPDVSQSSSHIPYKVQKALVESMMVPCINMKPHIYSELLMTLQDLVSYFFPAVPLNTCRQVLEVLGLELYRGNRLQMQILQQAGKCKTATDNGVALVQIKDVMQFMPQLKYMLSQTSVSSAVCSSTKVSEGGPAKRPRAS